jgi:hydroxymethylpyrimidine/phosphomethylpyrimidine kinase
VRSEPLPPELVAAQLDALLDDLDVGAVKSGMLGDARVVEAVARGVERCAGRPYVLDPVLAATGGHPLLDAAGRQALVDRLFRLASVVTPNAVEAALLADLPAVETVEQAERAGRRLIDRGARAVLVKGGHLERDRATDVLVTLEGGRLFRGSWTETPHTHGAGCALASAIATEMALGRALAPAVERAKAFVARAIRHAARLGGGRGAVDALGASRAAMEAEG